MFMEEEDLEEGREALWCSGIEKGYMLWVFVIKPFLASVGSPLFPLVSGHFTQAVAVSSLFQLSQSQRRCQRWVPSVMLFASLVQWNNSFVWHWMCIPALYETTLRLLFQVSHFIAGSTVLPCMLRLQNPEILQIFMVLLGTGHRFPLFSIFETYISRFL